MTDEQRRVDAEPDAYVTGHYIDMLPVIHGGNTMIGAKRGTPLYRDPDGAIDALKRENARKDEEIERLRSAHNRIADSESFCGSFSLRRIARAALEGKSDE